MAPFERLWIWHTPDLQGLMPWYRQVATNQMPAKFRIAQMLPLALDLHNASEDQLWCALDAATPQFLRLWEQIRHRHSPLPAAPAPHPNLLDLCQELS